MDMTDKYAVKVLRRLEEKNTDGEIKKALWAGIHAIENMPSNDSPCIGCKGECGECEIVQNMQSKFQSDGLKEIS